jgi:predicted amidohydrolase
LKKFRYQWVALDKDNEKIVGNGNSIQEAIKEAEKNGVKNPALLYVFPELETCVV